MPVRKTTTTTTTKPAPVKTTTTKPAPVKKATTVRKTNTNSTTNTVQKRSTGKASTTTQPTNSNHQNIGKLNIAKPGTSIGRVGNLGSDPEMRFSPNGTAVCSVSLAYTPYNFETKEQGDTVWYRCIGFNALAEQMAANLETGMRVIAVGRPQLNEWSDDEGEIHSNKEILLDGIGPDIRFANVSVARMQRRGPNTNYNARSNREQYEDEEPF